VEGVRFFETTQQALDALKEKPFQDSLILLKASRGMAFETMVQSL
jgi:UDP-N-acetylmuramoyl-tripeptide--D-alanyl-D-alanine ligase